MRVRKTIFLSVILAEFFAAVFLFPYSVKAANLNFSQSILPVRFVYLGKNNEIEKIWSNVSEKDGFYVIKFFNDKLREVAISENILSSYQETAKQEQKSSASESMAVEFIKSGETLEEVRTYC